tara:strand:- start:2874 stop:3215 length:342 start_codon:yes stop_codon:yes gene_type:complete
MQIEATHGQRIEFLEIDSAAIYAALAPLVTEAHAYLESGNETEGMKALRRARDVVEMASNAMTSVVIVDEPSVSESTGKRDQTSVSEGRPTNGFFGQIRETQPPEDNVGEQWS